MPLISNSTVKLVKVTSLLDRPVTGTAEYVIYCVDNGVDPKTFWMWRNSAWEEIYTTITDEYIITRPLTGLTVTGGTITSTDTILSAFGKVQNQLNSVASPMIYQGTWNANTNSPLLTSSTGTKGYVYRVTTSGATDIDGITDWKSGDFIVFNGTTWDKWDSTDAVTSVNGYTGNVVLVKADVGLGNVPNIDATNPANIVQNTNYRFVTDTEKTYWNGKQDALGYTPEDVANKATTMTGNTTSDVKYLTSKAVYDWGTSAFIPLNTPIVGATKTKITYDSKGLVTAGADATTADIADSLNKRYVTDANLIVINNTSNTNTGDETQTSIKNKLGEASATQDGYLSAFYWSAFNNKQSAISLTNIGNSGAASFIANTLNIPVYTLAGLGGISSSRSINTTAPLQGGGDLSADRTLSITQATAGSSGYLSSTDWNKFNDKQDALSGGILNRVTKWTSASTIGNSSIFDDGTSVGIGTSTPGAELHIAGDVKIDTILNATADTDRFLVSDAGVVKYRTGAELLADTGAQGAITLTTIGSSGEATLTSNTLNVPNYTLAGLGGVPSNRQLTINGVAYDLSLDRSWSVGTVTSVNMSVPTGFTIANNPVTTSGTLAVGFSAGYSLPTTASQTNWTTAYNDSIVSASVTGTTTKTITLTQQDGGTIQATWSDIDTAPVTSVFGRTGAVIAQSGDYTTTLVAEGTNLYFTDSRARQAISLTTTGNSGASTYSNLTGALNVPNYTLSGLGGEPIVTPGTTAQYWRGDKTWQTLNTTAVAEGTNLYFTEGRVRSTLLTGLSVSGGTISSTDSVLSAFGKIQNQLNAVASPMIYQGTWNASTNSPTLTSSVGTKGHVYRVTTSGSTNIDGVTDWKSGDFIVFNGTTWDKWDATDAVTSVNGYTGAVVITKADVGLSNVENTALSTWPGTTNITTLGTISTGVWQGTAIADAYIASAANWNSKVDGTGTANYLPLWSNSTTLTNSAVYQNPTTNDVGIGTNTPSTKLHVGGSFKIDTVGTISTAPLNPSITPTNWHRLATSSLSNRGGVELIYSTTGGNYAPATFIIKAYLNNTTPPTGTLILEKYGTTPYIKRVRLIVDDSDSSIYHIEGEIVSNLSYGLLFNVYVKKTIGYERAWNANLGLLPISTSTATPLRQNSFIEFSGGISSPSFQIQNNVLGNRWEFRDGNLNGSPGILNIFGSSSNSIMSLDDNNTRVGIGTPASGPTAKLHVVGSLKVDSSGVATIPASSQGWYRLANFPLAGGTRGGIQLTYSIVGGTLTPTTYVIKVFKNASSAGTIILEKYGSATYMQKVRIVLDENILTLYHIEAFVPSTDALSFQTYVEKTLGYEGDIEVNLGALVLSTSIVQPIRENSFTEFSGGVSSPSFQIQNNVLGNRWEFRDGNLNSVPGVLNVFGSSGNIIMSLDDTNTRVGIGTTSYSPTAKLHINNITSSDSLLVEDSTNPDASPFVIDNLGNVGIGLPTPATLGKLVVQGSGTNGLVLNTDSVATTNSTRLFFRQSDTNDASMFNVSGSLRFAFGGTAGTTIGSQKFIMTSDGRLGVNTTTTGTNVAITAYSNFVDNDDEEVARFSSISTTGTLLPAYLSIKNNSYINDEFSSEIRGIQTDTSVLSALNLTGTISDVQDTSNLSAVTIFRSRRINGVIANRLLFDFQNFNSSLMAINADGDLGIGTTATVSESNDYRLRLVSKAVTGNIPASGKALKLTTSNTSNQGLEFQINASANFIRSTSVNVDAGNTLYKPLIFSSTTDSIDTAPFGTVGSNLSIGFDILGTRILTLDSASNNVGIGTTAPTNKLHLKGVSGTFRLEDTTEGAGKVLTCDATGVASWNTVANTSVFAATTNKVAIWDGSGNLNYDNKLSYTPSIVNLSLDDGNDGISLSPGSIGVVDTTSPSTIVSTTWSNTVTTSSILRLSRYRDGGANYLSGDTLGRITLGNDFTQAASIYAVAAQNESVGYASDLYLKTGGTSAANLILMSDNSVRVSDAYTLPTTDGSANQILTTDGSGVVSWSTGASTSAVQHLVKAGVALTKGQAVFVSSANGTNMIVSKADYSLESTSSKVMGLIAQDLSLNGFGQVITEGLLAGLNTGTANAGDAVWLGDDGNLLYGLGSKPSAPNHLVFIGIVTRANSNNGEIFVKPQNGFELNELHDVQILTEPHSNETLTYDSASNLWKPSFIPPISDYEVFRGRTFRYDSTTVDTYAGIATLNNASVIAVAPNSTNFGNKYTRLRYYAAQVTTGRVSSIRSTDLQWFIGGGFRFISTWRVADTAYVATCQNFHGLIGTTAEIAVGGAGLIQVSTLTNCIFVGSDGADTNLQVMHNDASGTCTKINLGAGFPSNRTAGAAMTTMYSCELYNQVNSTNVKYRVINLETGEVAQGIITTNLPVNTQGLAIQSARVMSSPVTNTGQWEQHKWGCSDIAA
jgi:hypothetical protein